MCVMQLVNPRMWMNAVDLCSWLVLYSLFVLGLLSMNCASHVPAFHLPASPSTLSSRSGGLVAELQHVVLPSVHIRVTFLLTVLTMMVRTYGDVCDVI